MLSAFAPRFWGGFGYTILSFEGLKRVFLKGVYSTYGILVALSRCGFLKDRTVSLVPIIKLTGMLVKPIYV